jgi:hypothetical protein
VLLKLPFPQSAQNRSVVVVPLMVTKSPGSQSVHGSQLDEPATSLNSPVGHGEHVAASFVVLNDPGAHASHSRSLVLVPGLSTYSPGSQVENALHVAALTVAL